MASSIRPVVISGPSGSGKSTLLNRLFTEFPDCFAFSVSHTTRKPRPGEENGKDYYFVTMEDFEKLIADKGFLEHAQFSGNRYGTSKKSVHDILASGRLCFLDVEINGVKSIKAAGMTPAPRFVFIKPPSLEALRSRLQGRGTESADSLQKRLDTAQEALDYADQPGSYDHIIVNDDVDVAYDKLKGILIDDIKALQQGKKK
ncbi:uncharacterized protein LOC143293045 [Babylonia areolata]|uniref:uncharacterized protein LOC143293045 n=1 Tax=Babylonia areolata TaxID=304850 RepID=UPI003FD43AA0